MNLLRLQKEVSNDKAHKGKQCVSRKYTRILMPSLLQWFWHGGLVRDLNFDHALF